MEKLSFVPSAVSEPRWAVHMCDKKCTANGFKFLGNCGLCGRRRRCSPYDKLVQKVLQRRAIEARRRTCGGFKLEGTGRAEGLSREVMGSFWHGARHAQNVGMFHSQKKRGPRSVLADVENETQNGTDGDWQQEASYNEEVELGWHSSDLRFEGIPMRRAYDAGKSGWETASSANGQGRR